jgi:hypothetical protein
MLNELFDNVDLNKPLRMICVLRYDAIRFRIVNRHSK